MVAAETVKLKARVKRLTGSFERLKAKNEALCKALDRSKVKIVSLGESVAEGRKREKSLAEILRAISGSRTDAQPVFDAIANAALRLIGTVGAVVTRLDGDTLHLAALTSTSKTADKQLKAQFPCPVSTLTGHARAIRFRVPYCVSDTEKLKKAFRDFARVRGYRSIIFVPLLRGETAIGTIAVSRRDPGAFNDHDIDLLKTFADQAVIAIQNMRLFKELQARNSELSEALEQQTATSDILRIISSSPTDTRPVFDAIVKSGVRLFGGMTMSLRLVNGNFHEAVASTKPLLTEDDKFPLPVDDDGNAASRSILRGEVAQDPDYLQGGISEIMRKRAEHRGYRAAASAPMLKEGVALGAIVVLRATPGLLTDKQVALLKTFADQAVIAIENVRLFKELQAKNAELTETLGQQTATAEILKVISGSPTDTQPVFHAIAKTCQRLLQGKAVVLLLVSQGKMEPVALLGEGGETLQLPPPQPLDRDSVPGTSILDCRVVHVPNYEAVADAFPRIREMGISRGYKSGLYVPLIQYGNAIGSLGIRRGVTGEFTEKEITLLQTFADQAVIAIENARLFNETKEALEQQKAISGILQAISQSPTDTEPVFDAIVNSGLTLFEGLDVSLRLVRGEHHELVASTLRMRETADPFPCNDGSYPASRAMLNRESLEVRDIVTADWVNDRVKRWAERRGWRATFIAPMLRGGTAIGVIQILSPKSGPFTQKRIALLKTFADQAVIAIENVRLFKELQTRNAELTEALEQKTATSDILRVISSSPTDAQPVFDAIAANAARLCAARDAQVLRVEGGVLRLVSASGAPSMPPVRSISRGHVVGRAVIDRQTVHVHDMDQAIREFPETSAPQHAVQSILAIPLLRNDGAVGVIRVSRTQIQPFTSAQIALLQTFADQAVIAIENVRLFKELQARNAELTEALEQQTATAEILRIISRSPTDTQPVFDAIVRSGSRLFSDGVISLRLVEGEHSVIVASTQPLVEIGVTAPFRLDDHGWPAVQAILSRAVVQVPDFLAADFVNDEARRRAASRGFRAIVCAPLLREGEAVGTINLTRKLPGVFSDKQVALLRTFADQAVIAIENVRMFNEIRDKSHQLEIANQHKSEFLANMSHELRTPLNAVIGFSEVLQQGMVGEVNEKQGEYINYIHTSGSHLLSLINDILDLSKVEAGRMELDLSTFNLAMAIDNALTLVKERATRHGLSLDCTLDSAVAEIDADERKFKQILLNLLSNAVKFTPEGGQITVTARAVNAMVEVSVTDTGIGIAPQDCEAVFEEFRQVGTHTEGKAQGTGLGLALTKKFIELHGGKIWLTSALGRGSTFTFTLPLMQPSGTGSTQSA